MWPKLKGYSKYIWSAPKKKDECCSLLFFVLFESLVLTGEKNSRVGAVPVTVIHYRLRSMEDAFHLSYIVHSPQMLRISRKTRPYSKFCRPRHTQAKHRTFAASGAFSRVTYDGKPSNRLGGVSSICCSQATTASYIGWNRNYQDRETKSLSTTWEFRARISRPCRKEIWRKEKPKGTLYEEDAVNLFRVEVLLITLCLQPAEVTEDNAPWTPEARTQMYRYVLH